MATPPEELGLSSDLAFERLIQEAKSSIAEWYSVNVVNKLKPEGGHGPNKVRTFSHYFCTRTFLFIRISLIFLIVGSVDIENRITFSSVSIYALLLLYTVLLEVWQNRIRSTAFQQKYRKAFEEIEKLEASRPAKFQYHKSLEAVTDDVAMCQSCIRDGVVVDVPRLMLVIGDVIIFRPGQVAPCNCETFDGRVVAEGEKLLWDITTDPKSGAVIPLEPVYARVTCYPIKPHLEITLSADDNPLQFDYQLQYMIHKVFEHYVIPFALVSSVIGTLVRFYYSDDENLFGTRFVFAVPSLTILPLLILQLPLLLHFVKFMNNKEVARYLGLPADFESCKDLVSILASITGTTFIDKKGILSCVHPSIEKVVVATNQADESGLLGIHLEVMNLSSDQDPSSVNKWNLSMDDPNWQRYLPNLLPLSYNLLLNSCHQSEHFHKFLDHLAVISTQVPRTIATANRRCMCQLPHLMGFTEKSMETFQGTPKILGFYKKQPGEAPLPGLTKHRTPIEMAFCTIREDSKSLHSHLACQGTANLVVDACTHIWNGESVISMSKRLKAMVKDFYQRHSMTGHCLAVSYRPIFSKISTSLNGKFIEVPLNQDHTKVDTSIPRSHSNESLSSADFTTTIRSAEMVIDQYFTGNILCGLVVLHYEPLPKSVTIIERLDQICVRPVYFSKENELRSRVFAEKLGIEAGWNCHISLAEEETASVDEDRVKKKLEVAHEQFVAQEPVKPKFWKRIALSESNLEALDCESLIRGSPSLRKMSMISAKVAPIPNIARLPTGVKNVRPHLEEVDNVPLLVGLFTDSTTPAVEEMVDIMQENGEVVMVIGSSRNPSNTVLFTKANVSICVDEVEEAACRLTENGTEGNVNLMSSKLIALATDFRLNHDKLLLLSSLIVSARHRMSSFRHSLLFLLYSSLLLTLTILMSTFFFLPIIFTHSQTILTSFIHIPVLFLGTLFTNFEPKSKIIRIAPKNSDEIPRVEKLKAISQFIWQFVPSSFYINAMFLFLLMSNSNLMCSFSDISCLFNTDGSVGSQPLIELNDTRAIGHVSLSTETIRHVMGLQLTLINCILSSSFVFGLSSLWFEFPLKCVLWDVSVVICIGSQIGYSYLRGVQLVDLFSPLPLLVLLAWIIVIVIINELIKIRRIRQFTREQRRTKFEFDTKLGMNSPY